MSHHKESVQLTCLSLEKKLKALRFPLRKWEKEVFGHIEHKIISFQTEITKLDKMHRTENHKNKTCLDREPRKPKQTFRVEKIIQMFSVNS